MPFTTSLRFFTLRNSIYFLSPRKFTSAYKRPFSTSFSSGLNVLSKLLNPYQLLLFIGRNLNCFFIFCLCEAMDSNSSFILLLCGKSTAENEIAKSIKTNNTLKLPDNNEVSILLQSELEQPLKDDNSFRIDSFMNSLSTNQLGRFLIWSPRLPSTHDVVSK